MQLDASNTVAAGRNVAGNFKFCGSRYWRSAALSVFAINALGFAGSGLVAYAADNALRRSSSWNWPDNAKLLSELDRYLNSKKQTNLPASNSAPGKSGAGTTNAANNVPSSSSNPASIPASPSAGSDPALMQTQSTNPVSGALSVGDLQTIRGWGLLERLIAITSQYEPAIASLVDKGQSEVSVATHSMIETELEKVLANGGIPDWLKADLQLWVCRNFVQNALYDEAIDRLESIPLESVSDPSTLLFNLAVCQHHLLRKDECLATLQKLLEREADIPTRYAVTARLMEADIKPLEEDSLDEISRLMNDVERRLSLGRTGKIVQDKQQTIVDKLDKSIDKFEQQLKEQQRQQQQQQQNQQQNDGKNAQATPGEMKFAEVKGEGDVEAKDLGKGSGWGNLPPAQRQEALQNMTKDLPSHYRDVIEAYFKRLATTKE